MPPLDPSTNPLAWLTRFQGLEAWLLVYALVALPFLVGLLRGRATGVRLLGFPVLAAPVTALAVLFTAMLHSSLATLVPRALAAQPRTFELAALVLLMLFG